MEDKNETHYFLDGNPEELERLDLGQAVISDYMGKLVYAPVDFSKPGLRILDSATANGELMITLACHSLFLGLSRNEKSIFLTFRRMTFRALAPGPQSRS